MLKAAKIPNNKFYRDLKFSGVFTVKVNRHQKFRLYHFGGTIENGIFWKGLSQSWETEAIWLWQECCRFSNVIFDIGANTGVYSMIAKAVNPKAAVTAFEPSNNTYYKLVKNNSLNRFNITCENVGLSNKCGMAQFFDVFDSNQTSASLDILKLKDSVTDINEYEVSVETLENYTFRKAIEKIDLIKIDVELHEKEVLEGFGDILKKSQPLIFIEVLTSDIASSLNKLFEKQDYRFFHLRGHQDAIEVPEFIAFPYLYNYFIFPKSKTELIESKSSLLEIANSVNSISGKPAR